MRSRLLTLLLICTLPVFADDVTDRLRPLDVPPPSPVPVYLPFPNLPAPVLDEVNNRVGVAQQTARARQLQGRVLWIDGLANLDRVNTAEKILALVAQVKSAGFTTIVFDIKPIPGFTLYPSDYAPKMVEWGKGKIAADFDPLAAMVAAGHAAGLEVVANLNAFCEGHRLAGKGPGFTRSEWQSTLCEPQPVLLAPDGTKAPLVMKTTQPTPAGAVALTADLTNLTAAPTAAVVVVDAGRKVLALMNGLDLAITVQTVPKGGAVLVGEGDASKFLRGFAYRGETLTVQAEPTYVLAGQSANQNVALWTNPHSPQVQQRLLDMIRELMTRYAVDGIIFDDRLRYAGINADFSEETRRQFEAYIGKVLTWPDDVLRLEVAFPSLNRRTLPGPYYDAWLQWRALTIRNWLARATATVKTIRPTATVSVYAGSWYGEYFNLGSNWAADDFQAGFRFLTDGYRRTGFAGLLDWMTTGCYYSTPTTADASALGFSPGVSVEAAGQLSNRAANDSTWVYAGISLDKFDGNPDGLARALQAACASTQGVMVFDLSHKIDQFWPVFHQAFARPAIAPHAVPGLLDEVRAEHLRRRAAGICDPPVIIQNGAPGTGL